MSEFELMTNDELVSYLVPKVPSAEVAEAKAELLRRLEQGNAAVVFQNMRAGRFVDHCAQCHCEIERDQMICTGCGADVGLGR